MSAPQASQPSDASADPLIDEVRAIRRSITEQFGNDVDRLCDHLQELERGRPGRLVAPTAPGATRGLS